MLPATMRVNREVRAAKLAQVGAILCGGTFDSPQSALEAGIQRVEQISRRIGIPGRLSELGVEKAQIPAIVQSSRGNSMSGNPRDVGDDELTSILEAML
jgi:alcohol dehydrogenase class IV